MTSPSERKPLITRETALELIKNYQPGGPHTLAAYMEILDELLRGPEIAPEMREPDFSICITRDTDTGKWSMHVQWEGLRKHLAETFPRTSQFAQHVSQLIYTVQACQVKPSSR